MSRHSSRSLLPSDIIIPNEFRDFNILPDDMRNEIASFLFSDDKCPLESSIKKQIKPKSKVIMEFQNSFEKFRSLYQTKATYFLKIPNFTLLYAAMCLGLPLENFRHIPVNFIQKFLGSVNPKLVSEDILDVIIPFTIYRIPNEKDKAFVEPYILFLAEHFSPSIFMRHLLNCLEIYIKKNKINAFQIDTVALLYDRFNFEISESRLIEKTILRPLENVKDNIRLGLSCDELRKKIQVKVPDRSLYSNNNSSSSLDLYTDQRSPRGSPHSRSITNMETLNILLDDIEKGQYGSPTAILLQIKNELDNCNEFPHRSPETLLSLALRSYSFQSSIEAKNSILELIYQLNTICDPFLLLKIYLQIPISPQFQGISSEFVDKCYRDFIERRKQELNKTPSYPESLFDVFQDDDNLNGNVKDVRNPNYDDIDTRLDLEFRRLLDWDSAYDAVCALWELFGRYKNDEIRDLLIRKFDELDYAPKSFLVQGLRELEDQTPRTEDSEMTIRQLEDYFKYNLKPENPMNINFASRSTSPRVGPKPYSIENQKMTPTASEPRINQSPKDPSALRKKRITSNGASLRTGNKSNH